MKASRNRLGIAQNRRAGGGVARVPNRDMAGELTQDRLVKDLGNEAHVFVKDNAFTVADSNAGGLLATVLEREEAKERHTRHILTRCPSPKDPTLLVRGIVVVQKRKGYHGLLYRFQPPLRLMRRAPRW